MLPHVAKFIWQLTVPSLKKIKGEARDSFFRNKFISMPARNGNNNLKEKKKHLFM